MTLRESLPSQELTGQAPFTHQDGAGALPGSKREQGVAVLPDESHGPAGSTAATSGATGAQPRDWSANPVLARPGDEEGNESLGVGERRVGRDVAGGVGALVGGKGEEGVAVLPDERGATRTSADSVSKGGKGDKLGEMDHSEREERDRYAGTQKPEQRQAANKVSALFVTSGDAEMDGGPKDQPDGDEDGERDSENKETQMNLLAANLKPRVHSLGTPDAKWRGVGVGAASGYLDGEGVDIGRRFGVAETPEHEVRCPCPTARLLYVSKS